jgi:hypothetical protein
MGGGGEHTTCTACVAEVDRESAVGEMNCATSRPESGKAMETEPAGAADV